MNDNSNYTDVILEDMNSKFDRIIEAVGQLRDDIKQKANQSDIDEIKSDTKIIKAAVTDTSKQVSRHDMRLSQLEARS